MGEYDRELKILMELIKANDKSSNDKFETISERLREHSEINKEDFKELKNILQGHNNEIKLTNKELIDEVIKPMKKSITDHDYAIKSLQKEKGNFVKTEICKLNEDKIDERFKTLTYKVIGYNILFGLVYLIILLNSNISFNWNNISKILSFFKGIFF